MRTGRSRRLVPLLLLCQWLACTPQLKDAELLARCARSRPSWASYEEDLKAQIGATPTALWQGRLTEAQWEETGQFKTTFEITGPWSGLQAMLPILLKLPDGEMLRNDPVPSPPGQTRVYWFSVQGQRRGVPWVELKYPHEERRISLDDSAMWRAGGGGPEL